ATEHLEKDVEDVKGSFHNKTLALQRIQLGIALKNKMMQNDDDSRLIVKTMKQIVKLSNTIIENQQKTREKEEKLIGIKRKRLSLKKAEQEKAQQIHTMMKKQNEEQASMEESEALEKILNSLKKERDITTVIQNVLQ
ncbi:CENPH protein, partial [Bucco capensis]|nr:CENPH protein [Bucco capensis]